MPTSSFLSTKYFPDFLEKFQSRKLLIQNPNNREPITAAPPPYPAKSCLPLNVMIVLSFLVLSLICSLGFHFLLRCVLIRRSRLLDSESNANSLTTSGKSSGIKKKALRNFPVVNYSTELKLPGSDTECVICLSNFLPGERVRMLLICNHGFHVRCIDKWLRSHSSCPKCRHCLLETRANIVESSQASSSGHSVPETETAVSIRPLEPHGIVRNYGRLC